MNRTTIFSLLLTGLLFPAACKKSEDTSVPTPPADAPVAEKIQGYWLPSADSLFEMEKANLESNPPPGGVTEALLTEMRAQIEASVSAFILHIENGKTRALGDERVETGTYTLSGIDEAAGTFTAALSEDGGETVTGKGSIDGNVLKLSTAPGTPPMALDRTSQAEWDRRMNILNGIGGGDDDSGGEPGE